MVFLPLSATDVCLQRIKGQEAMGFSSQHMRIVVAFGCHFLRIVCKSLLLLDFLICYGNTQVEQIKALVWKVIVIFYDFYLKCQKAPIFFFFFFYFYLINIFV